MSYVLIAQAISTLGVVDPVVTVFPSNAAMSQRNHLPAKNTKMLENDIPWLTKPKKGVTTKTKREAKPKAEDDDTSAMKKKPSSSSDNKEIPETPHICPSCGKTGHNTMSLTHIFCDGCLSEMTKGTKMPKTKWCPMHYADGQKIGPHEFLSQITCGCCAGTCEICNPPAEAKQV